MTDLFKPIFGVLASLLKSRVKLEAEILVLRQQINVLTGAEKAAPKQYRSISVCLALSLVSFHSGRDCGLPTEELIPLAEVANRSEVRRIECDDHHEIIVLAAGSRNARRRIEPTAIGNDSAFFKILQNASKRFK